VKTSYYGAQNTRDTKRSSNYLGERHRSQDYLRETTKEMVESLFLYRILKVDYKDSALIKTFLPYIGSVASNSGSWWPPLIMGCGGGVSRVVWAEF